MRRVLRTLLFLFLLLLSSVASADANTQANSWADWNVARTHFETGNFASALEALAQHPEPNTGSYYHNLGTTYYRLGNYGLALANLEKANQIHPHHPDIQNNLAIARQALGQQIGFEKLDPGSSWLEQIADQISFDEVRATLGFLTLGLILVWIRNYSRFRALPAALLHPASYIGLIAVGITFTTYMARLWANSYPCSILVARETIRSGPSERYQVLHEAETGSKLRVLGPSTSEENTQENWSQVRYASDAVGWVKSKSLLIL